MPTYYDALPDNLRDWALAQPVFFTATAPTYGAHVNVSPKGHTGSSLAILGPNECAYLDATGSGCETAAHLRDNGRITLMWLSFGSSPRILRLFCRGEVVERGGTAGSVGAPAFEAAVAAMRRARGAPLDPLPAQAGKGSDGSAGWRAVVRMRIFKVQTSCGWGVPLMTGLPPPPAPSPAAAEPAAAATTTAPATLDDIRTAVRQAADDEAAAVRADGTVYKGPPYRPRVTLANFMATLGARDGVPASEYQAANNVTSLDGLPGYRSAKRAHLARGTAIGRVRSAVGLAGLRGKVAAHRLGAQREGAALGLLLGLLLGLVAGMGWEAFMVMLTAGCIAAKETIQRRAIG